MNDELKKKLMSALMAALAAFIGAMIGKNSIGNPQIKVDAPPGVVVQTSYSE